MRNFFATVNLNRRRFIVAVLVFFCLLYLSYRIIPHKPALPPRTVIAKALNDTARAGSFIYRLQMKTIISGKEGVYTDIEGRRKGKDRIYIKGRITESDIEFYQIGSTTYTKDQVSGDWIKIKDNQLNQQEIFAAELNPLANFSYREIVEVTYDGIVKDREEKVWKYTVKPIVGDSYLEILWKDFVYEFWIDRGSGLLTRGVVTAVSKTNPQDKLKIEVSFDYDTAFEVEPPV
ncbi:hypothetical protein Tfer_2376 [Thermincola ferriacetica]|uniref:Uncharacterized protein n=1 Tax=Thermincola ferriacetica TaxID=281456 RepID=A0A0L6W1R2_9FIRM|nr:hypothetical protein [Thermincola ferriacetica]KNZ69014.1 hypothetical protein Tfer_2376 [Thermincola ferriacetica]